LFAGVGHGVWVWCCTMVTSQMSRLFGCQVRCVGGGGSGRVVRGGGGEGGGALLLMRKYERWVFPGYAGASGGAGAGVGCGAGAGWVRGVGPRLWVRCVCGWVCVGWCGGVVGGVWIGGGVVGAVGVGCEWARGPQGCGRGAVWAVVGCSGVGGGMWWVGGVWVGFCRSAWLFVWRSLSGWDAVRRVSFA